MELDSEINTMIQDVTKALGKPIESSEYWIVDRGMPHQSESLLDGMMGVYTFWHNGKSLKIGKAGSKSSARFTSQHYSPKSARSTLAASILKDDDMQKFNINEQNVGEWIKSNCHRIDILIKEELGVFTMNLIESALHFKYEPKYEGFTSQR